MLTFLLLLWRILAVADPRYGGLMRINNNNNSHDNVYGAVIMTKVIARIHPVHLMNADWVAANPQTKPVDLGCESAENWQLSSTSTSPLLVV